MSTEAFENLYFDVCTHGLSQDGRRDGSTGAADEEGRSGAHFTAPEPISRSASRALAPKCAKATATSRWRSLFLPGKGFIQGRIQFNTPTLYSGTTFENVCLEFKDGKVVKASSNNTGA